MCIYMYICIYIYICKYLYTYIYVFAYTCKYSNTSLNDHLHRLTTRYISVSYDRPYKYFKPTTSLNGPRKVGPTVGRFREVLLTMCTDIHAHERSVLEMAAKAWNSQTVEERNIPDLLKCKRYLLRQ